MWGTLRVVELVVPLMMGVAFITLAERKVMGSMQRRSGPNLVGYFGLLQPMADGVKLVVKETVMPRKAELWLYVLAPMITLLLSLLIWLVMPYSLMASLVDYDLAVLYMLAISTLSMYGVLYGGWVSRSKYSILGALRATAQLVSYEVSIGIIVMCLVAINGTMSLVEMVIAQAFVSNVMVLTPVLLLLFVSLLAETNRTPFDLLEAESELVAGFLVEYSSLIFAAFYLGEYCFVYHMSALLAILGFGVFPSSPITALIIYAFIWVSASLPRLRYDQLMYLGWGLILPLSLSLLLVYMSATFLLFLL